MSTPDYAPDDFKCGTFDPKIRALITPEMRAKMDADFGQQKPAVEKLAKEISASGCEICAGPVAWFESVCPACVERRR